MSANPQAGSDSRYGEIFDRGYQHYDGPRRGRRGAITSLIGFSMKRAMGIRKSWTAKILPFILYVSATIPLIVMIGVLAVFRTMGNLDDFGSFVSYTSYFGAIFTMVGLFVAICAPEMICVDRQERTLPLYFSRAINRFDYVFAKIVAMALLCMTMTALPAAILWFGRQLTEEKVRQALVDNIGDLWRVLLVGVLASLTFGTLGLMISSFTNRKGVAIAIILIGFMVVTGVAQGLSIALEDYSWSRWILLGDLSTVLSALSINLFHDTVPSRFVEHANFTTAETIIYMIGVVLLATLVLRWRYAPRDDA